MLSESKKVIDSNANELNFIRHKLEKFQTTILKDVEKRIGVVVDEVMQELRQRDLQAKEFKNFSEADVWSNRASETTTSSSSSYDASKNSQKNDSKEKQSNKRSKNTLPDKIFINRESYLTALLKVDHMRAIYHIFHIIFFILFVHAMVHDYIVEGSINFGLKTMKQGFGKFHYVLAIWLIQHVFVFLLYYAFRGWMLVRAKLNRQSSLQRFWSHSCLIVYIGSQICFGYVASYLCLKLDLPFGSTAVSLLESIRLLMKMHAFVRTNCPRVLAGKLKCDSDINENVKESSQSFIAPFSWYVYFLFAPTLLYRDTYPRTSTIRWKFAIQRFIEGVAVAFFFSYLHERHMRVYFGDFGIEPLNTVDLISKIHAMFATSIMIFLGGFYLLLHSWLNFTSEILRFGDRMFYMDWWTSSNYAVYYRKWNVPVHDWLYEFVYKDCYKYLFCGSKVASSITVFTVSAVVHEYALSFAMKLFFPVMFIFFDGIGLVFVFLTQYAPKNLGNIFLWFSLIIGNSLMVSLYYMEYYARKNCHIENKDWFDYFLPAIWKCKT